MDNFKQTFWSLIKDYSIEIPTIQRDYTYGRLSTEEIRIKLIADIKDALVGSSKRLHLDFVYGKLLGIDNYVLLNRNKQSIETLLGSLKGYAKNLHIDIDFDTKVKSKESSEIITFIPLDGQQRLTTLFLVHWYLANKNNYIDSLQVLNRFTYSTRSSSKDFLELLCNKSLILEKKEEKLISEKIKNHELFFSYWIKDPTVYSMLIVLDEIEKQFKNLNQVEVWGKLVSNNKITFDFFNLDEFEQTDDLYVKMNARGKYLTQFEKFKAWLIKEYKNDIGIKDWRKKIDLNWNDLFWKNKLEQETTIDDKYLQFFRNMYVGDYLNNAFKNKKEDDDKWFNKSYISILREKLDENPLAVFKSDKLFGLNINTYFNTLDYLDNINLDIEFNLLYNKNSLEEYLFTIRNNNSNWRDATLFFAITRFLILNEGNFDNFQEWIRFISNLIYNSIIEDPIHYTEACNSILQLLQYTTKGSVYENLAKLDANNIDFFLPEQKEEEILKCKSINGVDGDKWEIKIKELENHKYFYGQIGFIYKLTKDNSFVEFEKVANKVSALFSEEILNKTNYLLFRAFLSKGECFIERKSSLTYPSNIRETLRNRNANWRRIIEKYPSNIQKLITDDLFDKDSISLSLENIIDNEINTKNRFIKTLLEDKEGKLLKYPPQNYIRKNNFGYYLLNSTRIFGYYRELYTYAWFLKNEKNEYKYIDEKGVEMMNNTGIKISSNELIYFERFNNKFKLQTQNDMEFDTIDEAIKFVTK